jgi:hypothetical protein
MRKAADWKPLSRRGVVTASNNVMALSWVKTELLSAACKPLDTIWIGRDSRDKALAATALAGFSESACLVLRCGGLALAG